MSDFVKNQIDKEKKAAKSVWKVILWLVVIIWFLYGIVILSTPAWLLGIILIISAAYVAYRILSKESCKINLNCNSFTKLSLIEGFLFILTLARNRAKLK